MGHALRKSNEREIGVQRFREFVTSYLALVSVGTLSRLVRNARDAFRAAYAANTYSFFPTGLTVRFDRLELEKVQLSYESASSHGIDEDGRINSTTWLRIRIYYPHHNGRAYLGSLIFNCTLEGTITIEPEKACPDQEVITGVRPYKFPLD